MHFNRGQCNEGVHVQWGLCKVGERDRVLCIKHFAWKQISILFFHNMERKFSEGHRTWQWASSIISFTQNLFDILSGRSESCLTEIYCNLHAMMEKQEQMSVTGSTMLSHFGLSAHCSLAHIRTVTYQSATLTLSINYWVGQPWSDD